MKNIKKNLVLFRRRLLIRIFDVFSYKSLVSKSIYNSFSKAIGSTITIGSFQNIVDIVSTNERFNPVVEPNNTSGETLTLEYPFSEFIFKNVSLINASALFLADKNIMLEYNPAKVEDYLFKDRIIIKVKGNNVLYYRLKLRKTKIEGRVISLIGKSSSNYYHLLMELLPKYFLGENAENTPVIVSSFAKNIDFCQYIFKKFDLQNIIYLDDKTELQCDEMVYRTIPFYISINKSGKWSYKDLVYDRAIIGWWNKLSELAELMPNKKGNKLFLIRNNFLRSYNFEEIREAAVNLGFKLVDMGALSFKQQIDEIYNADVIIGPTGASFANLIFAREGTKVVIWMHPAWGQFPVFSTIAKLKNFDLKYIDVEPISLNKKGEYFLDEAYFIKSLTEFT